MQVLDTKAVSEFTGIKVGTLRYWRHIGTGPKSFRMGPKKVYYRLSDVQEWMDAQYADAIGEPA